MATIFTRIINGEIPCYKVAENEHFFAFLDIQPVAKGHTLVVPKKEVDYIFDHDDETLQNLIVFAKRVAKAMDKVFHANRIGLSVIGLEVPHTHIHLIPINSIGDMTFTNERPEFSEEEMAEIAEAIARQFNQSDKEFTYDEFLALILIYTANASDGVSLEELDFIEKKVGKSCCEKSFELFDRSSEVEIIETINDLSKQFAKNRKEEVLSDIQELINVDQIDQEVEEHIMRMLRKLLQTI